MVLLNDMTHPVDGILHVQQNTAAQITDTALGPGCIYVTEKCVSWINESGKGFSLEYPSITLHAISRDIANFPHPCVYLMCNVRLDGPNSDDENSSDDDDDDDEEICEVRFIPQDIGSLDEIYQAISSGNMLHPDPDDSLSEEDDDNYEPGSNGHFEEGQGDGTDLNGEDVEQEVEGDQFENADDAEEPMT